MADVQRRKGWFNWLRGSPEADEIDAADVGTAFGMELSFDAPAQPTTTPVKTVPAEPPARDDDEPRR